MLYDPYKFPKDNIIGLDDALDTRVNKSGDIMTGDLSVLGTNSLVYEGQVPANAMAMISNANNTVSVSIAGTEVYSGNNTGHHSVYFTDYEGRMVCVPYGMGSSPGYSRAWTIKVYLPTTIADLTVNGDIVDREGNKLSDKADSKDKVDIGVIADVFDYTATYAVGDYVMYNGVLYKCTTAHTGTWAAADFAATLVSDEFGSGGGGSVDLSVIADEFSTSVSYAVGDYVTYNGKMYKCTTAHSGEWNASDFAETNVGDELEDCGGGETLIKGFKDKTWTGYANLNGAPWMDVDGTVYYSNGSNQYELDKATGNWSRKTWQGVTSFSGSTIWNDGVHTYMSSGATQYELTDRTTGTWTAKTWEGLTNFSAADIWSDGTDIYYDSGNVHYIYDKNNASWSVNTWTGVSSFQGRNVWTDGEKVYLSNTASQQLELDVATKTWSSKTWTCPNIAYFYGERVWSDGEDIFYSNAGTISFQWVLDKATSTWYEKTWIGAPANKVSAGSIWTDGSAYYISNGSSAQYVLSEYTIEELLGIPYGIATLNEEGRIPLEQTNYVTAGQKSGTTLGSKATAEGDGVEASAAYAHGEGKNTKASSTYAHAEGYSTQATGGSAHAEGESTKATGNHAHAEGGSTTASHQDSHAEGTGTQTGAGSQHVGGKYNVGKSTTLFEIGNGTANNARSNAFEVEADGDVIAAGEITDGGNNVLSDKYDATSLVFVNERFTISASGWSSTQTSGYYTYTLSTGNTKYNTYSDVIMANVGVDDSTDATSAEKAAYALVNKFDMADGTGVDSFTLYAKTKPTTTFYIKLSGRYMAKNAASSTKALDIETANPLLIGDADGNATRFDGSTYCELVYNNYLKMIPSGNWTSTVDSDGYYTNTLSVIPFNTYNGVDVRLSGSTIDTLPTAAQIAAYNLVDIFYMANGTDVRTLVVKARTKPTTDFYVTLKGSYID